MGMYRMKIEGRKTRVLVRAKSLAEAKTTLVDGESLSAEEMEDALAEGLKVWKAGDPLPNDAPPELQKGTAPVSAPKDADA